MIGAHLPGFLRLLEILIQITALLGGGILVQRFVVRSAPARHAVLFWAILAAALCPLLVPMSRNLGLNLHLNLPSRYVPPAFESRTLLDADWTGKGKNDSQTTHLNSTPSLNEILLLIWCTGATILMARLAVGLTQITRMRRYATPVNPEILVKAQDRLRTIFGSHVPIFVSARIRTPIAVGFSQSVVVLPSALLEQLDDSQLLHVLVHESAHALRHDPLVGLVQRLAGAMLWFHPLMHLANRQLSRAREELCDNFVLRAAAAGDYARTLLRVAETLTPSLDPLLASSLIGSPSDLERRINRLLNNSHPRITHWNRWKLALVASAFMFGGMILGAFALADPKLAPTTQPTGAGDLDLTPIVDFQTGATQFHEGDLIEITDVRGTSTDFSPGNTYLVRGTYSLQSVEAAKIAVSVTTNDRAFARSKMSTAQIQSISAGSGEFSLTITIAHAGTPHVSFYPIDGGNGFGGVYFGKGDSLRIQWPETGPDWIGNPK